MSKPDEQLALAAPATPMQVLQSAIQQGVSIEHLQALMALQERWEANEARKAFVTAFAAFKAEVVQIVKNKSVTDGPLKGKKYAELFAVVNAVTPALSKHGLSAAWKLTKDDKDWIEVTCTVTHQLGHAESVSMAGPPDTGGAKNAIMARASTVTYLERYTLKAACGLAEQDDDTDGSAFKFSELAERVEWIKNASTLRELETIFKNAYREAEASGDKNAMRLLIEAKDKRKGELA